MKTLTSLLLVVATMFIPPAGAVPKAPAVSNADARAIRTVIEHQLDAFAADDPARAFSYAAPAIRQMFGTPERFMSMVRNGYPVVYRPASVTFLKPERVEGELVQAVQMTDAEGTVWVALYRMQRQPDKTWRIGGVELGESRTRAI